MHEVVRGFDALERVPQRADVGDVTADGFPGATVLRGVAGHREHLVPGRLERRAQPAADEPRRPATSTRMPATLAGTAFARRTSASGEADRGEDPRAPDQLRP